MLSRSGRAHPSYTILAVMLASLAGCGRHAVAPQEPQVAAVEVAPSAVPGAAAGPIDGGVALSIGDSLGFTAVLRAANGAELVGPTVTWSTTDADVLTVSERGVVRAVAAGSARVRATSDGKSGLAGLVVQPASGTGIGPVSRCDAPESGWIWCDDFEQDRLSSYFEHSDHGGDFVRAPGVGRAGSSGMRARWTHAGQVSAGWMHVAFGRTPGAYFRAVDGGKRDYREIFWRFYLRNAPGWTGGGGHKISRAKVFARRDWTEAMQALVWSATSPHENFLVLDPVSYTDATGNLAGTARWLGYRRGTTPVFDADHVGRWHCIEAHVRLNDAGESNGLFELWLDGVPEASRSGLNWVGAYDEFGINTVTLDNYWNGGAPQAQERYLDDLVVSTERIGC
jgi:hypothetical protein